MCRHKRITMHLRPFVRKFVEDKKKGRDIAALLLGIIGSALLAIPIRLATLLTITALVGIALLTFLSALLVLLVTIRSHTTLLTVTILITPALLTVLIASLILLTVVLVAHFSLLRIVRDPIIGAHMFKNGRV